LFAVGIIWPIAALARVSVEAVAPVDATAGDTVTLRVRLTGRVPRLELRVLDPPGTWWRTAAPASGEVPHLALRRGEFWFVRVQLRTSAPLGVFSRSRIVRVELPAAICVGPRPTREYPVLRPIPDDAPTRAEHIAVPGLGDSVRAVRPYVPGDPARLVHWPTSARRGELVVRELEPPAEAGVALVVDLGPNGVFADQLASRAAGIGRATLAAGGRVWCCTHESDGGVSELVTDARELGRRLARAIPGPPPPAPDGWPVEVVR
jgi:uncharacterized protein (DUF58 family)